MGDCGMSIMLTLDEIAWREVEIPFRLANWYHEVLLGGIDIHGCNFNKSTFRVCQKKTIFSGWYFFPKEAMFWAFFLMVSQYKWSTWVEKISFHCSNPILWKPTWKWFEFHGGHILPPYSWDCLDHKKSWWFSCGNPKMRDFPKKQINARNASHDQNAEAFLVHTTFLLPLLTSTSLCVFLW